MADTFLPSVLFGAQGQQNLTPDCVTWSGPHFRTERTGYVGQKGSFRVNQEQAPLGELISKLRYQTPTACVVDRLRWCPEVGRNWQHFPLFCLLDLMVANKWSVSLETLTCVIRAVLDLCRTDFPLLLEFLRSLLSCCFIWQAHQLPVKDALQTPHKQSQAFWSNQQLPNKCNWSEATNFGLEN